jgi:hypothetical protein
MSNVHNVVWGLEEKGLVPVSELMLFGALSTLLGILLEHGFWVVVQSELWFKICWYI